ncbi:MAG: hypothetical protein OXT49_06265 [Gammaproteobacteria bacterium]|nr:hypothetical protein [Gammaproteobacteria bacterium]
MGKSIAIALTFPIIGKGFSFKRLMYLSLLVLTACSRQPFEGPEGQPTQLYDIQHQLSFEEKLRERKIPFYEDDMGFIRFPLKHQAEIFSIKREVVYGETLNFNNLESMVVTSEGMLEIYRDYLDSAGISYTVNRNNGRDSFIWSQIDGPRVDEIRQKVMQEQLIR